MSESRDDRIWGDYQAGLTYQQLADRYGISPSRARHICNRRAITTGTAKPVRTSMLGDRNPQAGRASWGNKTS